MNSISRLIVTGTILIFACVSRIHAQTTQPAEPKELSPGWTQLFNGTSLDGFSTFVGGQGIDQDPEGYFKVEDGMIHVLGLPATDERKQYGYFSTKDAYGDYHLRVQYKWGEKKFNPRQNQPRDSGVLYHMHGPDKVWPDSIECQVQEGDTGEMIIVGNQVTATVPIRMRGNQRVFSPGGAPTDVNQGRVYKDPAPDSRTDWNTVEVITKGNRSVHIINGVVIMKIDKLMLSNGSPLTSGRIVFQAEGAEVWYRNLEIRPLGPDEQLPDPTPIAAATTAPAQ